MIRPTQGTPEYDLWLAAISVAAAAPLRQGRYVAEARIPWHIVDEVRGALDALGIDWQEVKRKTS